MAIGKLAFSTRTASTTMIAVKSVLLSAVLASTMVAAAQPKSPQPQSQAKPPAQLELFGVQLKSATREQLREVFEAGGLQPVRVEDNSVSVSRGWPDTTTYLTFTDPVAHAEMRAEQEADKRAAERERAKAQTRAF